MWLLILFVYVAPVDAVDWSGDWKLGITRVMPDSFNTQLDCHNDGKYLQARLNEGMKAPVRYQCIKVDKIVPSGL